MLLFLTIDSVYRVLRYCLGKVYVICAGGRGMLGFVGRGVVRDLKLLWVDWRYRSG